MQSLQGKGEMLELEAREKLLEEYDKVKLRKSYIPRGQKRVE